MRRVRKELGLSQDEIAALSGVSREMWGKYERGAAMPGSEVLIRIAGAGADVLYVLTGERGRVPPPTAMLPARVRALLANYEAADDTGKRAIETTAAAVSKYAPHAAAEPMAVAEPSHVRQRFEGAVGQAVSGNVVNKSQKIDLRSTPPKRK